MRQAYIWGIRTIMMGAMLLLPATTATLAEPRHGIAMYGEPALPPDFVSLPYANPDAPKGGRIVLGEVLSYDSLNPYIVKGQAPAGIALFTVESLLGRSYDESFTLYGLLAESVDTDPDRTWVEFTLRPEARFADGSPVTVDDVLWSYEKLGTEGNPRYATAWKKIATAEQTGPRSVRFTFNTTDRELPLILGLRPILKKTQWQGKDFATAAQDAPIGSGPYVVADHDMGRYISYKKNPDWWGKDLPFNRGLWNLDEILVEYFGDDLAMFEAFKAGELTSFREFSPAKWAAMYDFPAVTSGKVIKAEIPQARPSGIEGLAFNLRKPMFQDWRVRQALSLAFNFELVNQTRYAGGKIRITSYFANSELAGDVTNPANGAVLALLTPYKDSFLPGAIEGYALPPSDGTEANRKNLRAATAFLEDAGWTVQGGVLKDTAGTPFTFEILLQNGTDDIIAAANIYVEALKRLGIVARVNTVDAAQYKERTTNFNFDMTHYIRSLSLSPGNEQTLYWGSVGVNEPGSRNWMGVDSPAVDGLIKTMLSSGNREDFTHAVKALDRVLTSGRYVIPFGYSPVGRLAYARTLHYPEHTPVYGDWPGFQPDVWWYQE